VQSVRGICVCDAVQASACACGARRPWALGRAKARVWRGCLPCLLTRGEAPSGLDRPARLDSTYMVGRQGRSCGARWRERPAARRRVRAQAGVQGRTYHKKDVHNHLQYKGGRTKGRERTGRHGNKDEEDERPAVEHAIDTLGSLSSTAGWPFREILKMLSLCLRGTAP